MKRIAAVLVVIVTLAACTPAEEMAFQGTMTSEVGASRVLSAEISTPADGNASVRLKWSNAIATLDCLPVGPSGVLDCPFNTESLTIIDGEPYRSDFRGEGEYDGSTWSGQYRLQSSDLENPEMDNDNHWRNFEVGDFELHRRSN